MQTGQDVEVWAGQDLVITATVTEGGAAKNLTGATLYWELFKRANDPAAIAQADVTIVSAAAGTISVSVSNDQLAGLCGTYYHEIFCYDVSGNRVPVLSGDFVINPSRISSRTI